MEILIGIATIAGLVFSLLCLLLPVFVWRIAENTAKATRQNEQIIRELKSLNAQIKECIHE